MMKMLLFGCATNQIHTFQVVVVNRISPTGSPCHPSIYSFSRRENGKHEKIALCFAEVVFDRCQVSKY